MQDQTTERSAIEVLQIKTDDDLALLVSGWHRSLLEGFTIGDWEEAIAMVKANPQSDRPLVDIAYQLLIIYRRYRSAEPRSATVSTEHSPTQTER